MKNSSALWTLMSCQALLVVGLALSFPFLALYLHEARGLPMTQVGAALAFTVALSGIAHFLGGEYCDLRGSKIVMSGALIMRGAGSAAMAWAMWNKWPPWTIITLNAAAVFGGGFFEPGIRSWIAECVPSAQKLKVYGWQRVAINAGWALGPAIGGAASEYSYPMLFAVTAAICWLCALLITFAISPTVPSRPNEDLSVPTILSAAYDSRFLEFCLYSALIAIVMGQLVASFSVHCVDIMGFSKREVGWLFSLNGLVVIGLQTTIVNATQGFRLSRALALGCVLYSIGYMYAGHAQTFSAMALAMIVITLGEIVVSPGLPSLATNLASPRHRGRYIGFHGLFFQTGSSLAPLLGGFWLERLSPTWPSGPWIFIGCVGLLASIGFLRIGRLLRSSEDAAHGRAPAAVEIPLAP
ncbi:MAG: MFS transporter [Elusimicrobiota bacterium]|nr:MAG: MFS transporter [Elusimicrobiota bacterium]